MSERNDRLVSKLKEQVQFIRRSCAAFDAEGAEDEAIRIATSLRIMFHDTRNSTSLLSLLGSKSGGMLSSTRGHGDWLDYLSIQINVSRQQPVKMLPIRGTRFREVPIPDWWETETVFIHKGVAHPRRMIILSAANKDGGAHVDESLEEYYEFLCSGEWAVGIMGNLQFSGEPWFEQGITHYGRNAHLALIRQFAHEVLASVTHFSWLQS